MHHFRKLPGGWGGGGRCKGAKTSKAPHTAINTSNYPASLKASMLLPFPARKQAPDCAAQNGTFSRVWSQRGRRGGGRPGKEPGAQEGSAQLAGGRQSGRLCGRSPGGEQECVCLRLAGAGGFLSSRVLFLARRHVGGGWRNVGVRWLPGASLCPYSKTTGSIRKNMKFPEDRESPEPNPLRKAWVWGELLALPP